MNLSNNEASQTSINATPARNYPLIDERFVFEFIEWLVLGDRYCNDDIYEEERKHRVSEFWNSTNKREQAKHLAGIWFDLRELRHENTGLFYDYYQFRDEFNGDCQAAGDDDCYTAEKQNASEWR